MNELPQKLTDKILATIGFSAEGLKPSPIGYYFQPTKRRITFIEDENFEENTYYLPMPYMIFVYVDKSLFVFCSPTKPTENAPRVYLPNLPNISGDGYVCLGTNEDGAEFSTDTAQEAINLFWNTAFFGYSKYILEKWQNDPKFLNKIQNYTSKSIRLK